MKAAILKAFGTPLAVETVADPVLGTGEVIVDVVATPVLAYAREEFSGARNFLFDTPAIPGAGAIGRVRAAGPDATRLKVGDWVYCDPTVRSRDGGAMPGILLQGLSAGGPGGQELQKHFHDGSFAQQMRLPTENAIPIGAINALDATRWCALGRLLVPYGGFLAADLKSGEIVLVNGATGAFGGAAVAVALAMGASFVVATGRNAAALADIEQRFGPRLRTVQMLGDEAGDRARILAIAPGPIDCVFDILPPAATSTQVRTAIMTVRPYGRAVLMGGVGMLGGEDLALPYPWIMRNLITVRGQWMYDAAAIPGLVGLVRGGLLDLGHWALTAFPLTEANAAVAHAAANAGPFKLTVLKP